MSKYNRNDINFLIGAAQTYKALERPETALIYCNKALRLEPNNSNGKKIKADILYEEGVLFYNEEKYVKAVDNFRIAIKLLPQKLDSYIKIINAYNKLKEYEWAVIYCNKALWIDQDNNEIKEIRTNALIEQANLLYDKEEYLDSIKYYNLAAQLFHEEEEKINHPYVEKQQENLNNTDNEAIYYVNTPTIGEINNCS